MNVISYLFGVMVLSSLALSGAANAAVYTPPDLVAPNIPRAGAPSFLNNVAVKFEKKDGGYKLTATQTSSSFIFNSDPTHAWAGKNGTFSLTAKFNSSLGFIGGNVSLKGQIPGYAGLGDIGTVKTTVQNLFSSSLTAANFDLSPLGLGFRTSFAAATGWAKQFMTVDESVWFYGADLLSAMLSGKAFTINAKAITTVPVPAAAWLFGSGLAMLAARRRKSAAGVLAA